MAAMEACPNCGLRLAGKARLCPRCGGWLTDRERASRQAVVGRLVLALAGLGLAAAGGTCAIQARGTAAVGADYFIPFGWLYCLGGVVVFVLTVWRPRPRGRGSWWIAVARAVALLVGAKLAAIGGALSLMMVLSVPTGISNGGPAGAAVCLGMIAASLLLVKAGLLLVTQATAVAPRPSAPRRPGTEALGAPPVVRGG